MGLNGGMVNLNDMLCKSLVCNLIEISLAKLGS